MGNIGTVLKRFFTNKNTVTLLAIVIGTVILYFFYNSRVNKAVTTEYACYAKEGIKPKTIITEDMVSRTKILSSQATSNLIKDCSQVIGKYVSYATEVAPNSLFYTSMVMTEQEMPGTTYEQMPDKMAAYNFNVTFQSTYGNSIFPGTYIDLYMRTTDESGALLFGKFVEHIKVDAVVDSEGKNVFETTFETREPSQLIFIVDEDLFLLLKKAEYLGIEIVIVPRGSAYSANDGAVYVSSDYLKKLVLDQTATIPDECVLDKTQTAECKTETTENNTNANNEQTENTNAETNANNVTE